MEWEGRTMLSARIRILVVVVGCAVAGAGVVGCGESANPAGPSAVSQSPTSSGVAYETGGIEAVAGPKAAVNASGGPELAAVRRATAAFHSVNDAMNAGYTFGEPCVESPAGAMGVHSTNPSLIASQVLDPARPELLLYLPTAGGGLRLIGVEYLQTVLLRNTATGQVG